MTRRSKEVSAPCCWCCAQYACQRVVSCRVVWGWAGPEPKDWVNPCEAATWAALPKLEHEMCCSWGMHMIEEPTATGSAA